MGTELRKVYRRESMNPEFADVPKTEWESRIHKARALMKKKGLDALIILNNQNRRYFFGYGKPYKYVYPNIGIIPLEGPTTLVTTSEDADVVVTRGYAEQSIGYRGDTQAPTETAPDQIVMLAELVEELGLRGKTIGMEFGIFMWWDGFTMNEWERFKKELPGVKFVDATDLSWELRMIKSDWEIEMMRHLY